MDKPIDNTTHLPFYLKVSQIIIGLTAFVYILFIGQDIILPLIYATILAVLLNPFVNYLCRKRFNRVLAILTAMLLALIIVGALIYFISSQATMFSDTFPEVKAKLNVLFGQITSWVSDTFNVSTSKVKQWVNNAKGENMKNSSVVIGQTISTIGGVLVMLFLLPVYIFMILFYKPLLLTFISMLFPRDKHAMVVEVLTETKSLVQNYLIGLLLEAGIVAVLNAAGLLILGIEYAILLGILGALLNLIPYVGGIVGIAMPMVIALATKPAEYALYVFAVYILVQFIDNNFLVPKIVASKVKINALVSIIVVLVGGALWGIPGMFLSIPLTAILKVMFDRIQPLKPWGFLLGDTMPSIVTFKFNRPKRAIKKPAV
ncbi:MAG: AI-2E family transporter [Ferruginibacter sp.]